MNALKGFTLNGLLMAAGLFLGALLSPHLFPAAQAQEPAEPAVAEVVRAKQFELVDDAGKPRILLTLRQDAPRALLLNADGTPRLALAITENEPGVALFDTKGEIRMGLTLTDGQPSITLAGAGKSNIAIGMSQGGDTALFFTDQEGNTRTMLGIQAGSPKLVMLDPNDIPRALLDTGGKASIIRLYDNTGKGLWRAPWNPGE